MRECSNVENFFSIYLKHTKHFNDV